MRDTYVNCFVVDGRPLYVATGTTRVPGLEAAAPWNDGIFVWVARSLRGPWKLADTTGIRPHAEKGKVWSPEFADENRPGRTVVAKWQEYWHDEKFGKRGRHGHRSCTTSVAPGTSSRAWVTIRGRSVRSCW